MKRLLLIGVLVIVAFGVYGNALGNGFVWDDNVLIVRNPLVAGDSPIANIFCTDIFRLGKNHGSFYRPLQILSYRWEYLWWQINPTGYHLTNVLLHCLNGCLVFLLCVQLLQHVPAAGVAAAWFLVQPVHTEAVTYISGRADLLALTFILLSLLAYWSATARSDKTELWMTCVSLACFVLALLSRESALITPALIFLVDAYFRKRPGWFKPASWVRRYAGYLAIAAAYLGLRTAIIGTSFGQKIAASLPFPQRILAAGQAFLLYLKWLLTPYPLHMEHWFSPAVLQPNSLIGPAGLLAFGLLIAGILWTYRRFPVLSFGAAWFLVGLLPFLNIFVPVNAFAAEHWLYLPFIGIAAMGGWIWFYSRQSTLWKWIARGAVLGILVSHGILTVRQNRFWRDPITLFEYTIRWVPDRARLRFNLAGAYREAGQKNDAIREYQEAIRCDPTFPGAHNDLGNLLQQSEQYEQAAHEYEEELRLLPEDGEVMNNLGNVHRKMGQLEQAIQWYQKALEKGARLPQIYLNLATAQMKLNRDLQAVETLRKAIGVDASVPEVYATLGNLYRKLGKTQEAAAAWSKALQLNPNLVRVRENLRGLQEVNTQKP